MQRGFGVHDRNSADQPDREASLSSRTRDRSEYFLGWSLANSAALRECLRRPRKQIPPANLISGLDARTQVAYHGLWIPHDVRQIAVELPAAPFRISCP